MNKKELPQRKNKGINTFNTDWNFLNIRQYKQKSKKPNSKNHVSYSQSLTNQSKAKELQRKQKYISNKIQFKYTRGIHYFYNLSSLKRLPDSPSYVLFNIQKKSRKKSQFKINFSKQNCKVGESLISDLINRDYIGLPINKQANNIQQNNNKIQSQVVNNKKKLVQSEKQMLPLAFQQQIAQQQIVQLNSNHKNICHKYLFSNEDRKHFIDLQIQQCQYIKKKFNYFIAHQDKLKQFSFVQKDNDLYQLLQESLNQKEKYQLLQNKISSLKQKKAKCEKSLAETDQMYFYSSLNQVLYNKIKNNNQKLLKSTIYNNLLKILNESEQNEKKLNKKTKKIHLQRYNTYRLVQTVSFDSIILKYAIKLVSIRICQEGQHIFYRAKDLFLNIFQIDLVLQKQIKSKKQQSFFKKCKQISKEISNFYKKNCKSSTTTDSDSEHLQNQTKLLMLNQKTIELSMDDYYFVKIFTFIYNSLLSISEYLKKSTQKSFQLIDLLGSLSFYKFQNLLIEATQSQQFGMLPYSLDTLSQFLSHRKQHFPEAEWSLFSQYNTLTNKVSIFLKQNEQKKCIDNEKSSRFKRNLHEQYLSDEEIKSIQIMAKRCKR